MTSPGGFKVLDANGQALVYVYARETSNEANIAGVLTFDEARRIAVNVATSARDAQSVRPDALHDVQDA